MLYNSVNFKTTTKQDRNRSNMILHARSQSSMGRAYFKLGGGEDQDGRWDKIVMVFDWLLATSPPQPPMPISRLTGGRGLQIMVRNRRKGRSGKRCCWERHETWEFYNFINYSGGKLFVNLWMVAMVQGCMVGLFNINFKQKDLCYFFLNSSLYRKYFLL